MISEYFNTVVTCNKRKSRILVLLFCAMLFAGKSAYGNHLFGGELFYTNISGNTYKVTMILYGDCASAAIPGSVAFANLTTAQPAVEVYNGNILIQTLFLTAQPGSGVEVSPVCPDELGNTKCVNPNNALPGVKKFIYAANVTLSGPSANWRFRSNGDLVNSQAGRSTAITNISIPGAGSFMCLVATLDNTSAVNSSPTYTTVPTPFFCINKPQEYNQGAIDANGDSLVFALVPGLDASSNPSSNVTYLAPTSATAPLRCLAGSFSFSSATGQLSFYPNLVQNALVVSRVSEYRSGVLVGTSMREMTFVVLSSCNNNPPDGTMTNPTNGTLVNSTTVKACEGAGTLSFAVNTTDPDGDNVTLSVQGAIPGAFYNISGNGTPNPVFNFNWNLNGVTPGTYIFYLNFVDDGCPLVSKQTVAYTVQVLPRPAMIYAQVSPATCIKKAVFQVTPMGTDMPYNLNVLQGVANVLTRNNITGPITDSLAGGIYTFRFTGNNGCGRDTTINLTQVINIVPQVSWTQPYCPGGNTGTISVTATGTSSPFEYAVNALPYGTVTTFSGLAAGNHTIHIKDAAGCVKDTTITITNPPAMVLGVSIKKPVCSPVSNGQVTLTPVNGTAPYQYALNAGVYTATNTFAGLATGSYTLHVKDAHDCIRDTVITLVDSLFMQLALTATPPLCYGNTNGAVTLNPSGTTAPYSFALGTAAYGASGTYSSLGAGTYVFHIKDQNQCLKDTTITIGQPAALAFGLGITNVLCFGGMDGAVAVTAQGGTPVYQYAADGGVFQSSNLLAGLNAGTHTIHLKDSHGCTKDTTVSLIQPSSAVGFGPLAITNPTCEGFTDGGISFTANGGTPSYLYALNAGAFAASGNFGMLAEGSYLLRIKDNHGCQKDTTVSLTGFPHILIDEVSFTEPSCFGFSDGSLIITASGGNPPFSYQVNNGGAWSGNPSFSNRNAQSYTLKVKDANQCVKDTTVVLLQPERLVADTLSVGNDCNGIDDGGQIQILASGGTAPYSYTWKHDAGNHNAKITGLVNGRYSVLVQDAHGCKDSATIDILYNNCCTPYIPNAFTPNSDGRNDQYRVEYKGDMELKEMYIYNRYGQRIFSSSNVNKVWDGTFNGQSVDAGTYYYYIRILCGNVRKKELIFKGDLTLIR